jgi:hypothetical protein
MPITTEQEVINKFFPDDDTKTIEDVINILKFTNMAGATQSRHNAILSMKGIDIFINVTDWSI